MNPTALIIDDEVQIRRLLRVALEAGGYVVREAEEGQKGLAEIAYHRPDIVILDLGLPGVGGLEVLRRLREWSEVSVVVLSVRDAEEEKVAALDAGADDYVTKPFGTAELMARLRVAQRRSRPNEEAHLLQFGRLEVDLLGRCIRCDKQEVKLTATEYALLAYFVRYPGRILTHRQILREVWGPNAEEHRQYLRVYIAHLRKKIERDPSAPELISTEPGIGYRFAPGSVS